MKARTAKGFLLSEMKARILIFYTKGIIFAKPISTLGIQLSFVVRRHENKIVIMCLFVQSQPLSEKKHTHKIFYQSVFSSIS